MTGTLGTRAHSDLRRTPPISAYAYEYRPADRVRRERRVRTVAWSLTVASLIGVVVLWLTNSGLPSTSLPGSTTTALGRVTGLLASDLLLIQVLTMARVPWLERAIGRDRLTRWHRWAGFSSFNLMIAHIILVTVGYAQSSATNVLAQSWDFVVNYPGVLLAVAGTLALVMVVATSLRAARRRMRYESWHLLHLYAYVGAGLALPHQLWTGQDFTSSTTVSIFWWGLWGLAAGAIIAFRIVLPLWRSVRHKLRVSGVIAEAPGVYSVVMSGRGLDRMGLQAGQFCQWRFLSGRGWSRAHPYTISARPYPDSLRITVEQAGDGSHAIGSLRPGVPVLFEGPYGTMTADRRTKRDVLLIAAGAGITPMRGLAQSICAEPPAGGPGGLLRPSVVVAHRIRSHRDALFVDDFADLARSGRCRLIQLVGRRGRAGGWLPSTSRPALAVLRDLAPDIDERAVYVCGNDDWMSAVRKSLAEAGVKPAQIHCERFAT
ncbi:putative ferric reductase [Antricoccus suffuscus]|uniref:Putative ferric reductase n=1 Tax=Antricoccus suffuscus TaxID=1629062 RepID=A0A2T0ZXH8_9ACTN|nr:ferredoxin reductase family protein [Antricoccus suffuscus]PRZ41061.1 putative ferric reductase [Antricoccus suffuscus]